MILPLGEYTRKLIGTLDIPLLDPVIRSVSASISRLTSSKSTNFLPLQCKNSAYSETDEKKQFVNKQKDLSTEKLPHRALL